MSVGLIQFFKGVLEIRFGSLESEITKGNI